MYEWLLSTSNNHNHHPDSRNVYKRSTDEIGEGIPHLLFSNEKATSLVTSLMNAVEKELSFLFQKAEELSLEDQLFLEQAYRWMKDSGNTVKSEVIKMVHLLSQEESLSVFEKSMETLLNHFKRRQQFSQQRETDIEIYVEWLLELPYLMKERLENAFDLAKISPQHPITHHEVQQKNSRVGYYGNLEPAETRASSLELALCC